MTFFSVILSILVICVLPVVAGAGMIFFSDLFKNGFSSRIARMTAPSKVMLSWFFGQLIFWSIFQFIATYNIIKSNSYMNIKIEYMIAVGVVCVVSGVVSALAFCKRRKRDSGNTCIDTSQGTNESQDVKISVFTKKNQDTSVSRESERKSKVLSLVVILGIIIQVILAIVLAYMDVDDSYYVSEAAAAISSEKLYVKIPYTGISTQLDARHALAPFPIWLALISDICGIKVVSMAHVIMPALFLPLTYGVYALFGTMLFEDKKKALPVFMLFTELLTVFGFYSYMTPEKFLMTRIRQGKTTIASLIIPGIIMCLFMILKSLKEDKNIDFRLYVLLFTLNVSGCLCSTLGALICVMPVFICAVLAAFMFKRLRHLIPMAVACLPCLIFAVLYLKL